MQIHEREYLLAQLISGYQVVKIQNTPLKLLPPTPIHLYEAESIFQEKLLEARWTEFLNKDQLYEHLSMRGYWTDESEEQLKGIQKDIDTLKENLFSLAFQSGKRAQVRQVLKNAQAVYDEMLMKKHAYDHLTDEGFALSCKLRYWVLVRLHDMDGNPVAARYDWAVEPLIQEYNRSTLTSKQIRELARTEPWRSVWNLVKDPREIFGCSVAQLNENQKSLLIWSHTYDSIYKSPDCPHDSIIDDDDMLDGWMIIQRKKREQDLAKKEGDEFIKSDKIRNSQEVYIITNNKEDAKKVDALNTPEARAIKRQRFEHLKKHGVVKEQDMPDTKNKLLMEINNLAMKQGKRQ